MTRRTETFPVDIGCLCPNGHRGGLLGLYPPVRDRHIAAFKRDHPQQEGHRWVDRLPKQKGDDPR